MTNTYRMALVFIRTAIVFVTLLVVMRLMGKSQIGEMQPFEFVVTLVIAELACIPMADSSIPLLYGVVAIVAIFILHQLVWLLTLSFQPLKTIISGRPSIVITRDGVDAFQLKKNNLDVSDLVESMRSAGYFSLDDVYYGLYESNGSFSALEKTERSQSLAVTLIDGGKIDKHNLALVGLSVEQLRAFLHGQHVKVERVLVMTVDGNGRVYLQKKGESYHILQLEGTNQW